MIEDRIKKLGIELPSSSPPGGIYVPVKRVGNTVYVSGQIPMKNGTPCYVGKVGGERSLEYAQDAARLCVINMLAALKAYLGDLEKIKSVVKLVAFVNSEVGFDKQHLVIDAASQLLLDVLGESGQHARSAVGTNQLPLNVTVEIEGVFEIYDSKEIQYDFDTAVNRKGIGNLKDYCTPKNIQDMGILSFSGAEMDFKTAPVIIDAMVERAKNGLFGFTLCDDNYKNAIKWWMKTQRNWAIEDEWIVPTYGTIKSVATSIRAFTDVGDGVIIQPPVYPRYGQAIMRTGRCVISNPLVLRDGRYEMDFDHLEKCMCDSKAKLMILCNPHNPISKVWEPEDLARIAAIAEEHSVIVFSDEIFGEIIFEDNVMIPYSDVSLADKNCLVSTSLGKVFNLTGMNNANIVIPNEEIRERFVRQRDEDHYGSIDPMAHAAVCAGYSAKGADWAQQMRDYVYGNVQMVHKFFKDHLPGIKVYETQGSYVLWIDWSALSMDDEDLYRFLVQEAFLHLEPGANYGQGGVGFMRMNIATTRGNLERALSLLLRAIQLRFGL